MHFSLWFKKYYNKFLSLNAKQVQKLLFCFFWLAIVLFPLGYVTREVLPSICLLLLLRYYKLDWKRSALYQFRLKYIFYIFIVGIFIGIFFSIDKFNSFSYVFKHINMGFVYPLAAMECIKSTEDLEKLIFAFVIASFWEGCDGIYQGIVGYDFIDHTAAIQSGAVKRLTGSLNDYRVGNYMALTIIPASGLFLILRKKINTILSSALTLLILSPGLYLVYFSYTRNAYFTLAIAAAILLIFNSNKINWKRIFFTLAGLVLILLVWIFFVPERFSVNVILHDGRWELWRFAWAVFLQHPWTGAGFWNFNAAFRALGFVPVLDPITISHPHDIYLQILCESGILGEACILFFLFGFLGWGYYNIKTGLRYTEAGTPMRFQWKIGSFFGAAWVAYLASGIVGHDFFRDWWFAQAMILLGIMIAACLIPNVGLKEDTPTAPST